MSVSVALCTYNGEPYLSKQIKSIINQTYKPSEIVVCDDGSTDGTTKTLSRYKGIFGNEFKIYENDRNLGVTKNFEKAIRLCDGEYIAISDQDDIWVEDKIEKQVRAIENNNVDLVFHNSTIIGDSLSDNTTLWDTLSYSPTDGSIPNINELFRRNIAQGTTMLFKSRFKKEAIPIPEIWDYDHYLALVAAISGGIYGIDEELLRYRQHEDQSIGAPTTTTMKHLYEYIRGDKEYDEMEPKKWGELYERIKEMPSVTEVSDEVKKEISNRMEYEYRRKIARNSNSPLMGRIGSISKNIWDGSYSKYGNGALSALNDSYSIVDRPIA